MKRLLLLPAFASLLLVAGCHDHAYYAPPPAYAPSNALFDLAGRNGFQMGAQDGARDSGSGYRFEPRRTRAYHETPGYDPGLGPFGPYQNAFRNSYLHGYDTGYYHR
ncbi:hypothetical protein [Granulicella tundricola]|uniref:Lipoprotein n=1 Tax=Granulicella tundricola (strain ATCC BAA-1859 / DSM 23138 / MP5ACTX9) TaxID=1198114 RepID=E8WXP9_GRATM|nr:hypothetical protein [Granulicella tundricola]ADW68665.1 hypothetical protein AciX9_1612 [Granulicella tundricola MP5ACTX9]